MSQSSLSKGSKPRTPLAQDVMSSAPDPQDDRDSAMSVAESRRVEKAPIEHEGRQGFLPISTNTFDRVFISVVLFVAIHLLWMRLVEAYLPLWVATILTILLGVWIVRKG